MSHIDHLRADLRRYTPLERCTEPGAWATVVYRLGRAARELPGPLRPVGSAVHLVAQLLVRIASGVELHRNADIGPGLRIYHGQAIVINGSARLGAGCTLLHGVTVGSIEGGPAPVIGDRVTLNAYAQVLGAVTVGDDAQIGAMSLVLKDVPPNVNAGGVPARVLSTRG